MILPAKSLKSVHPSNLKSLKSALHQPSPRPLTDDALQPFSFPLTQALPTPALWHVGPDNSLLWGLSCPSQDAGQNPRQHPWPPLLGCQYIVTLNGTYQGLATGHHPLHQPPLDHTSSCSPASWASLTSRPACCFQGGTQPMFGAGPSLLGVGEGGGRLSCAL